MDTDPNLPNTNAAIPSTNTAPRTRSAIDQRSLEELQSAEEIAQAAQVPTHATALATGGITPEEVAQLLTKITQNRTRFTDSVDERENKKNTTKEEGTTEASLRRQIRGIQSAARLKYAGAPDADNHLGHYYIGERITLNRASLATYTAAILKKLSTDTLPGITPARVAKLQSTYTTWQALNAAQSAALEAAVQHRQEGLDQLEEIKATRRRIQRAADIVFPVGEPEHYAARAAFHLEKNKPFRG
ncbi:MAG: hypothetical protein NTX57_23240 [Armatimonadetes bacterium]|nr:hypothetical protein [Armatimonadota bacterium]